MRSAVSGDCALEAIPCLLHLKVKLQIGYFKVKNSAADSDITDLLGVSFSSSIRAPYTGLFFFETDVSPAPVGYSCQKPIALKRVRALSFYLPRQTWLIEQDENQRGTESEDYRGTHFGAPFSKSLNT